MTKLRARRGAGRLALFASLALMLGALGAGADAEHDSEWISEVVGLFNGIAGADAAVCWSGVLQPVESGVPALDASLVPQLECGYVIDLYTFEGNRDDTVLVELFGPPRALLLGLLDERLEVMDVAPTSEWGEAAIALIFPETGSYTIAVMGEAAPGKAHAYSLYADAGYDLFRPCFEEKETLLRAGMAVQFELTVDPAALPDFCRGFESYLPLYGAAGQQIALRVEGDVHEVAWVWIDTPDRRAAPELTVVREEDFGDRVAIGRATLPDTGHYLIGVGWRVNQDQAAGGGRYLVELYSPVDIPASAHLPAGTMSGLISLGDYAQAPSEMQQYYLAGNWDGVWALINEIAHIQEAAAPPLLPSNALPLTEEEWRDMDEASRSEIAHDLVMWKLMSLLGEDGPLIGVSIEALTGEVVDGLKTRPPYSTAESLALTAWALLTDGASEPVGPSSTGAGGFWHAAPHAEAEPRYVHAYLLGLLDGWLAMGTEMQAIRESVEPPLLPAGNEPISSESWAAASYDSRSSLAARLAVWRFNVATSDRGRIDINLLQQALWDRVGPRWAWDDELSQRSAAMLFWQGLALSHPHF